jgi:hypothetical protein
MNTGLVFAVVVLSSGALIAPAAESPLPITVEEGGSATRGSGIAMYRELPTLPAGSELTFLGQYDPKEDRIRFLDPPWVHVTWPRRLHWRIYFMVKTGPSSSKAVSRYFDPAQADALQKLPTIRKYVEKVKASGGAGRAIARPELSLHEVYAGKVPEEFAELDARNTIVGVYCDNLGRPGRAIQQAFYVKPNKPPSPLHPGKIAVFTGAIRPNQPELSYRQKEERKLHHFNVKLAATRPIRIQLDEATANRLFKKEVSKAMMSLQDTCKRHSLTFEFNSEQRPRISWVDERMVVSGVITPRPTFSMKPVPYATASVFFNPETSQPERIVFVRRVHRDPSD